MIFNSAATRRGSFQVVSLLFLAAFLFTIISLAGGPVFSKVSWTSFDRGSQEQVAAAAVLDTSLLSNGLHELRLTAFDANLRGSQAIATVLIEGQLKPDYFSLGYRDLDLPLRGIPAQLNRAYDSRDKCPGDFGIGWNQPGPELRANLHPGRFWRLDEQLFASPPTVPSIHPTAAAAAWSCRSTASTTTSTTTSA